MSSSGLWKADDDIGDEQISINTHTIYKSLLTQKLSRYLKLKLILFLLDTERDKAISYNICKPHSQIYANRKII